MIPRPDGRSRMVPFVKSIARVYASASCVTLSAALLAANASAAQVPVPAKPPAPPAAQYPALPSEMPANFVPTSDGFDHVRREVMIRSEEHTSELQSRQYL